MPSRRMTSCCSATRSTRGIRRPSPTRSRRGRCRLYSIHRPGSNGRRSGRCATSASDICRPASCISSTAAPAQINADSNGCAAGNTLAEAIVQGFLELVERDSYAIWWYNRLQRTEVDLGQFDDSYVRDLRTQLADDRTPALGARRHQRSGNSELRGAGALDGQRAGKCRVRIRRAFRCANCRVARAHRVEPVPVHRSHGRRRRKQIEP